MDEFDLIDGLIAPLATAPGAQGLTNDGATLRVREGHELVITKDMMAAGIHFLEDDPPDLIARKLLRVNLSDLAAMGAVPTGYLLGFSSDGKRDETWLRAFVDGLRQDQELFGISLLGGDTIAAPEGLLTLSLTAFGEAELGKSLSRSGALPGDLVAVTGTIGDAALGLMVLQGRYRPSKNSCAEFLEGRYRLPIPRSNFGPRLAGHVHAALDLSDGLLADAGHIARRSGLAIELRASDVPLSLCAAEAVDEQAVHLSDLVSGGDDYELLFTFAAGEWATIREIAEACGLEISVIGSCRAGQGVCLLDPDGEEIPVERSGWRHKG